MQPMDGHFYTKDEETHSVFRCVLISLPFSVFIFLLSVLLLLLMMLMLISLLVLLLSLFFSLTLTAGPVLHCPSWPPLTWVLPSSKHTRQTGFPGVTQPAANLPEVPFHLSFFFPFPSVCPFMCDASTRRVHSSSLFCSVHARNFFTKQTESECL